MAPGSWVEAEGSWTQHEQIELGPDQLDYLNSVGSDGFGRTATEMSLCGTVIWASKLCKDFATDNM